MNGSNKIFKKIEEANQCNSLPFELDSKVEDLQDKCFYSKPKSESVTMPNNVTSSGSRSTSKTNQNPQKTLKSLLPKTTKRKGVGRAIKGKKKEAVYVPSEDMEEPSNTESQNGSICQSDDDDEFFDALQEDGIVAMEADQSLAPDKIKPPDCQQTFYNDPYRTIRAYFEKGQQFKLANLFDKANQAFAQAWKWLQEVKHANLLEPIYETLMKVIAFEMGVNKDDDEEQFYSPEDKAFIENIQKNIKKPPESKISLEDLPDGHPLKDLFTKELALYLDNAIIPGYNPFKGLLLYGPPGKLCIFNSFPRDFFH